MAKLYVSIYMTATANRSQSSKDIVILKMWWSYVEDDGSDTEERVVDELQGAGGGATSDKD